MKSLPRLKSPKPVKKLEECVIPFWCIFPKEVANNRDEQGRKCIGVGVNFDITLYPVGERVTLSYSHWSLLRDVNFPHLPRYSYDPIRGENGWYPF